MKHNKDTPLKIAVIGAGGFGQVHLTAYAQHSRVELGLVCDLSSERRQHVESKFGAKTCDDYRRIIDDKSIQAVSVVTPDTMHREIVTAMLEAGKHVLVEKPLATNLADAKAMVRTAHKSGKTLMVDFQNRWNPPYAETKTRIERGEFGLPVMAHARLCNTLFVPLQMLSWAGQSGPHWFLFPHTMDAVCWFFGRRAKRVTASGRKGILAARGIDTYDAIQALVEFEDCSAIFETAWILPESYTSVVESTMTLLGTKARIGVPFLPQLQISGEAKTEFPSLGANQEIHGRIVGWQLSPITHFVDSILAGTAPLCTPEDALHNTALICAVEKSISTGKTVAVSV